MPALLVLALVAVPIVELYVLIRVGEQLGVVPTLALLVVMSLLGGYLLRREGRRTWTAFREALAHGRLPAAEIADGGLVMLGGALLLTPGFATDAFGLLCVLPPTRAVLRRLLTRTVARRLRVGALGPFGPLGPSGPSTGSGRSPFGGRPSSSRVRDGRVVDGEVLRPDEDPPTRT